MAGKGVFPDDLDDILNRWEPYSPAWDAIMSAWEPSPADRVRDLMVHMIPTGKPGLVDIDRFVFGLDLEAVLDTKRIVGKVPPVRITAGQKAAILEARRLASAVVARRALEFVAWRDRQQAKAMNI